MKPLIQATVCIILGVASSAFGANCRWSGCEGKMILGQLICNDYGFGTYTGQVNSDFCSWDTTKVRCCAPSEDGECKFTSTCFGLNYGPGYACRSDFGEDYVPSSVPETSTEGCGLNLKKHKCCN